MLKMSNLLDLIISNLNDVQKILKNIETPEYQKDKTPKQIEYNRKLATTFFRSILLRREEVEREIKNEQSNFLNKCNTYRVRNTVNN